SAMLPLLLILFIAVPIAELAVIIQVGQWIGVLPTIALLILDSVLGTMLMRAQGRAAWRRFSEAVQAGRPPAREVLDGALVLLGGAFLLTPAFRPVVIGIALLRPPPRALGRAALARRLLLRMPASFTAPLGPRRRRPPQAHDVEGTAIEIDRPGLEGR